MPVTMPSISESNLMNAIVNRTALLQTLVVAVVALGICATSSHAQQLKVGSKGPEIKVKQMVQGELPKQGVQPYVVEFWATWCPPCRKSIPHLNDLYKKLKSQGMVILGISDEKLSKVKPFVQQKGSGMSYPIAIDDGAKQSWFKAAGRKGIPSAFVVDSSNTVVWIGNPLDPEFTKVVEQVASGQYNPALQRKAAPKIKAAERAAKMRNFDQAYKHMDEVIALDNRIFLNVAIDKYRMKLDQEKDPQAAGAYADEMIVMYSSDPNSLKTLCVVLATDPSLSENDHARARRAADQMLSSFGKKNVQALSASALVAYHANDIDRAVREQKMAWMYAPGDSKAQLKADLDKYVQAQRRKKALGR